MSFPVGKLQFSLEILIFCTNKCVFLSFFPTLLRLGTCFEKSTAPPIPTPPSSSPLPPSSSLPSPSLLHDLIPSWFASLLGGPAHNHPDLGCVTPPARHP